MFGQSYLAILAAPIPRAIWSEKPMGVGRLASQTFMPEYKHKTGVPPSPVGEVYWNFGLAGVCVIFVGWGIVLKSLWNFTYKMNSCILLPFYITFLYYCRIQTSLLYSWIHISALLAIVVILFSFCSYRFKPLILKISSVKI